MKDILEKMEFFGARDRIEAAIQPPPEKKK